MIAFFSIRLFFLVLASWVHHGRHATGSTSLFLWGITLPGIVGKGVAVAENASEAVVAETRLLRVARNATDTAVATLLALPLTDPGICRVGGEVN